MMKLLKKLFFLLICPVAFLFTLASCNDTAIGENQKDIVILATNDVHCGVNDGIGYAGVAAYKKYMEAKTDYVTLVDCGDAIQGASIGSITKGLAPIQIMNKVGYDYAIFGNHEFDYGMDRLRELTATANAQYLCCNITYTGNNELSGITNTKPYEIKEYGNTKVAFIGVSTPLSIRDSTPIYFKENGEYAYDFKLSEDGQALYDCIQDNIDSAKSDGADYIVLLSHLGLGEEFVPYDVTSVVKNLSGVDAIFDGHSHSTISCDLLYDKDNNLVQMCQTGTKLGGLGQLVISPNGLLTVGLITSFDKKDEDVNAYINEVLASANEKLNEIVATTSVALSIFDDSGIRIVRTRETGIANLVTDAYKEVMGAQIAISNAGGIRKSLEAGNVTLGNIIDVNPFGNMLCVIKMSGQDIIDLLEYGARFVQKEYVKDGIAVGEEGSFILASGLKYTVDTSIPSSLEVDDNDALIAVTGPRRVKNVQVLENNEYVDIDLNKMYSVVMTDYIAKNGGTGTTYLLANHELEVDCAFEDYQTLITYITDFLHGDLSKYVSTEGRIIIE